MAKIKLECKHCHKFFIVDWEKLIRKRTGEGYRNLVVRILRKAPEPSHQMTLDLKCPHCGKIASYYRSEGEEV